eukprot:tig00020903_g15079.t1
MGRNSPPESESGGSRPPWERIAGLDLDGLRKSDSSKSKIEELATELVMFRVELEDELATRENLVRLFQVSQIIIEKKQDQLEKTSSATAGGADTAVLNKKLKELEEKNEELQKELDEAVKEFEQLEGELGEKSNELEDKKAELKKKDRQIYDLEDQVERLRNDLEDAGTGGGGGGDGDDEDLRKAARQSEARRLKDELEDLQRKMLRMQTEAENKDAEYQKAREDKEKLQSEMSAQKERVTQLEKEVKRQKQEIDDYDERLKATRIRMTTRDQEQRSAQSQISEKNTQLQKYMKEISVISKRNEELETDLRLLTEELDAVDQEWKRTEAELKEEVKMREEAEANIGVMQKQIESLQAQVADIENQARSAGKATEKQLEESKAALSALKRELVDRDAELRKRDDLIGSLRQELNAMQNEAGLKYIVDQLQEKIGTKEERIKQLELELEDANSELEALSEALVKVHDDARSSNIRELEHQTKELEESRRMAVERSREREEAVESANKLVQELQERNEQIVQLRARLHQYEQGVYGLTEAVREIKELKGRIQVRDQDIATLTKQVNEQLRKLADLYDENTMLRDRLGITAEERVSLDPIRLAQQVELQQLRATNLQYMREVQTLEEERMQLKAELRLSALHRGERAVRLGLDIEDLEALESYADQLREGKAPGSRPRASLGLGGHVPDEVLGELREELKEMRSQLQMERERAATATIEKNEMLEAALKLREENAVIRAKYESLKSEVMLFMEDANVRANLAGQLPASGSLPPTPGATEGSQPTILSPGGPQGLAASGLLMQSALLSAGAPSIPSPASPMGVQGRFLRLYQQLQQREQADRHTENELVQRMADEKTLVTQEKFTLQMRIEKLQEDLALASGALQMQLQQNTELRARIQQLAAHVTPSIPLPDELSKTAERGGGRAAAEALAALNSQLVQCLDELFQREAQAAAMERELRRYRNQFEGVAEQQSVLYREHVALKKQMQETEKANRSLRSRAEEDARAIQELRASIAALQTGGEETVRGRVTELTLQLVHLQTTEGNAARKLAILELEDGILRRENGRLNSDLVEMERVLMTRASDLQRAKDLAEQRATRLQTELDASVPAERFQHLHRQHEIAMQRLRSAIEESASLAGARAELEALKKDAALLRFQLADLTVAERGAREAAEKHKHVVDSLAAGGDPKAEAAAALARLVTAQLAEGNAQRKADLATKRYEQAAAIQKELEERTAQLEAQVIDLTKKLQEADADRMNLQGRLDGTIPREKAEDLQMRLAVAERDLEKARSEVHRFKDLSDIAERQSRQLSAMLAARSDQLNELHAALRTSASGDDDKAAVGKLHYQLLQLRLGEASSRRSEEQAKAQVAQLNAVLRRLEQRSDEAVASLYRARDDYRQQIAAERQAKEDAQLRSRETISLKRFEALKNSLVASERKRVDLQLDATRIADELHRIQDEMDASTAQVSTLSELVEALKGGTAGEVSARLSEWSIRVQTARTMEGKLLRQAARLQERAKNLEADNGRMEAELQAFEEKCVRLEEHDERSRVQFEVHIAELNRRLKKAEDEVQLLGEGGARGGPAAPAGAPSALLEAGAPGNEKLQAVLDAARRLHEPSGAGELIQQLADMQADFLAVQRELQQAQSALAERDLMMTELQGRLRLQGLPSFGGGEGGPHGGFGLPGAVPNPRMGIGAGDVDLRASEELSGYLSSVADDTIRRLQAEVAAQRELVAKYQGQLQQLRAQFAAQKKVDKVQVERLAEEIYTEGDREVQKMREALRQAEENEKSAVSPVLLADEVDELLHERDTRILHLQSLLETAQRRGAMLEEQLAQRSEELQRMQHKVDEMTANDPSKAMQRQLALLRTKLATKEKEQYKLQTAIKDLKQELLEAADDTFGQKAGGGGGGAASAERDVEAATAELQQRFAAVQARMVRAKEEVERVKEANEKLAGEVSGLREQNRTLQGTVQRQANEVARLQKGLRDAEFDRKRLRAELDANPRAEELERKLRVMEKYRKDKPATPRQGGEGEEPPQPPPPGTPAQAARPASAPGSGLKRMADIRPPKPGSPSEKPGAAAAAATAAAATPAAAPRPPTGAKEAEDGGTPPKTASDGPSPRGEEKEKPATAVERWHAEKRLQKRLDVLAAKLEAKTKQCDAMQAQLARAKELIDKLERAGPSAAGGAARPAGHPDAGPPGSEPFELRWDILKRIQNAEEARDELAAAQQEIQSLRRVLQVEKEAEVRRLVHRTRELEGALQRAGPAPPGPDAESDALIRAERAERRVQELEAEAVERDAANVELRFDRESLALSVQRLQRRVAELQAYNQALAAMGRRAAPSGASPRDAMLDKENTPLAAARRRAAAAAGEKKAAELEAVVEAMKRVVERVQAENEALKRAVPTNVRYMELLKENKQLRQQLTESSSAAKEKGGVEEARAALSRTMGQLSSVQRQLKKEQEVSERRRQAVEHLTEERNRLEAEARALRAGGTAPETQRLLEESLIALQGQCRRLQQDADEQRVKVKNLKDKLCAAQDALRDMRGQLEDREREVVRLHEQVRDLEDGRREAEAEARQWRKQARPAARPARPASPHLEPAPREDAGALSELRALRAENSALKGELSHFDAAFFEEIEELKFRYAEAERLARKYEGMCRDLSARLGLDFPPPHRS